MISALNILKESLSTVIKAYKYRAGQLPEGEMPCQSEINSANFFFSLRNKVCEYLVNWPSDSIELFAAMEKFMDGYKGDHHNDDEDAKPLEEIKICEHLFDQIKKGHPASIGLLAAIGKIMDGCEDDHHNDEPLEEIKMSDEEIEKLHTKVVSEAA